jgi:hypothetical protein
MTMLIAALLLAAAPVTPVAATAEAEPAKEKLICRREVPIGSLIASRKICLTAAQWDKRSADGNAAARKLVQDGTGTLNELNN